MSKYNIHNVSKISLKNIDGKLKSLFDNRKESTVSLCLMSAGIKGKYLTQDDGSRRIYKPEFESWISNGGGASLYGSKANFTKYAGAGFVINYFAEATKPPKDNFDYVSALPLGSMRALYEIEGIIRALESDSIVDHRGCSSLFLLFHGWLHRTSDKDKVGKTTGTIGKLIHPHSTASDLKKWRENWMFPATKTTSPKEDGISFTELRISSSLFDWNQAGKKNHNQFSFQDLSEELARLKKVLEKEGFISTKKKTGIFKLDISDDKISNIKERYEAKEQKEAQRVQNLKQQSMSTSKNQKYKESVD